MAVAVMNTHGTDITGHSIDIGITCEHVTVRPRELPDGLKVPSWYRHGRFSVTPPPHQSIVNPYLVCFQSLV